MASPNHTGRHFNNAADEPQRFSGFTPLGANFIYCPNQFLDVCLPNSSRIAVRLVAYILDQTLGWLDRHGNPIRKNISISYRQLIDEAGISRGAVRKAIDEAIAAGYIRCISEGKATAAGQAAEIGSYALRWDESGEYQNMPESFRGFYAGEGHRTPIPNAFFRRVIPNEPLTVIKVVGTVLRHTVGYQNQFGGRRSQAPLSYRFIQTFANIPDPKTLREALSSAIASKYIVCIEEGRFHSDPGKQKPATYAVKWLGDGEKPDGSSKNPAAVRFNKPSRGAVQDPQQPRSNNPSSSGTENPARNQSKKPSKEKTEKNILKQQQKDRPAAADEKTIELLRNAGFDEAAVERLAQVATAEQIERQIDWLPERNPNNNRLGLLRRAIEEDWAAPEREKLKSLNRERRAKTKQRDLEDKLEEKAIRVEKEQRIRRRIELQKTWDGLSSAERKRIETAALDHQNSEVLRKLFKSSESHRHRACLAELGRELTNSDPAESRPVERPKTPPSAPPGTGRV